MFKKKKEVVETLEEPVVQPEPEIEKVSLDDINKEIELANNEKANETLKEIVLEFLKLSHEDRRIVIEKIKNGKI